MNRELKHIGITDYQKKKKHIGITKRVHITLLKRIFLNTLIFIMSITVLTI